MKSKKYRIETRMKIEGEKEGEGEGDELSKQNFTGHGLMVFCHGLHFDFDDCFSSEAQRFAAK